MNILLARAELLPIDDFKFGHTQTQIESFKVQAQSGCREFEYWQQVLQIRSLRDSIVETQLDVEDTKAEEAKAAHWFPFWNRSTRTSLLPRIRWRLSKQKRSLAEKSSELERHLNVVDSKYEDLKCLTEEQILSKEQQYWAMRLAKQMASQHIATKWLVNAGDMSAVLSLPVEVREQVLSDVLQLIAKPELLLKAQAEPVVPVGLLQTID